MTALPSWLTEAVALRREHPFTGSCWDAARDMNARLEDSAPGFTTTPTESGAAPEGNDGGTGAEE